MNIDDDCLSVGAPPAAVETKKEYPPLMADYFVMDTSDGSQTFTFMPHVGVSGYTGPTGPTGYTGPTGPSSPSAARFDPNVKPLPHPGTAVPNLNRATAAPTTFDNDALGDNVKDLSCSVVKDSIAGAPVRFKKLRANWSAELSVPATSVGRDTLGGSVHDLNLSIVKEVVTADPVCRTLSSTWTIAPYEPAPTDVSTIIREELYRSLLQSFQDQLLYKWRNELERNLFTFSSVPAAVWDNPNTASSTYNPLTADPQKYFWVKLPDTSFRFDNIADKTVMGEKEDLLTAGNAVPSPAVPSTPADLVTRIATCETCKVMLDDYEIRTLGGMCSCCTAWEAGKV